MERKTFIKVKTPLNKEVRITSEYWDFITNIKHPNIAGKKNEVIDALRNPEFIRKSKKDERVFLYYKDLQSKYLCVASKHLNGDGFYHYYLYY